MPLTQNLKTNDDVSYATSSLSGAEYFEDSPSLASWEEIESHLSLHKVVKNVFSMLLQVACD